MRNYIIACSLLLFSFINNCYSQIEDNINQKSNIEQDTTLAMFYSDSCAILLKNRKFKEVVTLSSKGIDLYKLHKVENEGLANLYIQQGNAFGNLSSYQEAIQSFQRVLDIYSFLGKKNDEIYAYAISKQANMLRNTGDFEKSISKSLEVINLYNKLEHSRLEWQVAPYHNLSIIYRINSSFDKAKEYALAGLDILLKNEHDAQEEEAKNMQAIKLYNNIGNIYFATGKFDKCLEYLKQGLNLLYQVEGKSSSSAFIFKQNIGNAYSQLKDFDKALFYFKSTLEDCNKLFGPENLKSILVYTSIGNIYSQIKEFDTALLYYNEQLNLAKKLYEPNHQNFGDFYMQFALTYELMGDFVKAEKYYMQSLNSYLKVYDETNIKFGDFYANFSNFYNIINKPEEAIKYGEKSLLIFKSLLGEKHYKTAYNYNHIAHANHLKKNYTKAFNYYQKSLEALNKSNNSLNIELIEIYSRISQLHYDQGQFDQAIEYLEKSISIIDKIQSSSLVIARDYFQSHTNPIYKNIINSTLKLDPEMSDTTIKKTFSFMEKSKANTLLRTTFNSKAIQLSNIPDSLTRKETLMKNEIEELKKIKRKKLLSGNKDFETDILELDKNIFDLQSRLQNLATFFESNYPLYYEIKYKNFNITLDSLQSTLHPEQSLVEYLDSDSVIYIIVVNQKDVFFTKVFNNFQIKSLVPIFRESLTKYHSNQTMPPSSQSKLAKQYIDYAHTLYLKLIAPIESQLKKNVTIIPDGILGYLPFEILLKNRPQKLNTFHDYPYLINDYNFSYCYSATMLNEMTNRKHKSRALKPSLSLAPFFIKNINNISLKYDAAKFSTIRRDTLKSLDFSGIEINKVANWTKGEKWTGNEASVKKFKEEASKYKLLHLSTHGIANDKLGDYAYLALGSKSNNKYSQLFVRDIYNLKLNADMVVLSACNSANGRLQRGEGIISMARAFAYAGAKSIITTHWSINDNSTSILMESFYRFLIKDKLPKDEALRQAKLEYIDKHRGLKAHPFYWAAFIGIGDMSPIQN